MLTVNHLTAITQCSWGLKHVERITVQVLEEIFNQDFLAIPKQMLQNYYKIWNKYFLVTDSRCGSWTTY